MAPQPHGEQQARYPAELSPPSQPDNRAYDLASEMCYPSLWSLPLAAGDAYSEQDYSLLYRPAAGQDAQCLFASYYPAHATATAGAGCQCTADPTEREGNQPPALLPDLCDGSYALCGVLPVSLRDMDQWM